jgi:predicted Zn-dependent peptidase
MCRFGGAESSGINVRALTSQLGPALDLMAEMLQQPGMRQTDLDRLKDSAQGRRCCRPRRARGADRRAAVELRWCGARDHPYGRIETEKSIDAVTLKDCEKVIAS